MGRKLSLPENESPSCFAAAFLYVMRHPEGGLAVVKLDELPCNFSEVDGIIEAEGVVTKHHDFNSAELGIVPLREQTPKQESGQKGHARLSIC